MSTYKVMLTAISVQSAKPSYSYGALPRVPVKVSAAHMLLRGPVSLPKGAVITAATIYVNQYDTSSEGSWSLTARRNFTAWPAGVTWNTKPAVTDVTHSLSKTNPAAGTWWAIDVTADVQGFVSGTKANYGWRLASTSSTQHLIRGHNADVKQPYLLVTYELTPKTPTNLSPAGGAVGLSKPVLTFTAGDVITSLQVQIDAAADSVSPDFDSGEVASTAGVLDLAGTAYAGLSDGSTTYWRARVKTSLGWSAWSSWVDFSRNDLDAVTLSAPTSTPADGSPPFLWSFAGTQSAWQATLLDSDGTVLADSGVVSGSDTGWTPATGLTASGDQGTARIRVWDNVDRIATPGVPAYSEDSVDFTVTLDGTVAAMSTLAAAQSGGSPGVTLSGTRTVGIPDEVVVYRNGEQVDRFPGTDIFTSSTAFTWVDWSAPLGESVTYRLAPVVGGAVASGGPTATITPAGAGIWLVDTASDTAAVLWDVDAGSWSAADLATVHVPAATGSPVVRRRLRRGTMVGTISGAVFDTDDTDASDTLAALEQFKAADAGTEYRLIAGHLNLPVVVGDIVVAPTPESGRVNGLMAKAEFNFWSV